MPAKMKLEPYLTTEELHQRYRDASDPVLRSHYHMLYLISSGHSARKTADLVGYNRIWVTKIANRYNEHGPESLGDRRHNNPGREGFLDAEQQAELALALEGAAPDGGRWNGRKIAAWIAEKTGQETVYAQRGIEWAHRLGYALKRPRRQHRDADEKVQQDFKEED